jgi:uncharacterized membrane protein YfcA
MPIATIEQSWPLLAGLGCLSGFLSGLLGIGGGLIIVPALVLALPLIGVEGEALPRIAIATSVAIMIPTAIASAQQHSLRGSLDWPSLILLAPSIVSGSFVAGYFAQHISTQLLCLLFVTFALHTARGMIRRPAIHVRHETSAGNRPSFVSLTAVGLFGGALSSLIGLGNAFYSVPFLARFIEMSRAIGTAATLNVPLALAGVLGYAMSDPPPGCGAACFGYVYLPAVAAIGISAVLAAPAGALLTRAVPVLLLRRVFAVVLVASAVNLAAKTLPLAEAPELVTELAQRLTRPVPEALPVAALPPACLTDPLFRTPNLVAEYGPRQSFTALRGDCPPAATVSAALSTLRSRTERPVGFWYAPSAAKAAPVVTPPLPERRKLPSRAVRKPVPDKAAPVETAINPAPPVAAGPSPAPAPTSERLEVSVFDPFGFGSGAIPPSRAPSREAR